MNSNKPWPPKASNCHANFRLCIHSIKSRLNSGTSPLDDLTSVSRTTNNDLEFEGETTRGCLARKVAENRGAGSFPSSSNVDRSTSTIKERERERRKKKGRKDLESIAIAFRRRSNFEKDGFPHFTLYYPVRAPHIHIWDIVIRRLFWDLVSNRVSNFRLERGLICGFEREGELVCFRLG